MTPHHVGRGTSGAAGLVVDLIQQLTEWQRDHLEVKDTPGQEHRF